MKESTTYQAILEEGAERGRREGEEQGRREGAERGRKDEAIRILVLLGTRRFGAPSSAIMAVLEKASLTERESMVERMLGVETWNELLDN